MEAPARDAVDARPAAIGRIDAVDLARAAALIAMAIYHFAWDLEFFGYSDPGTTAVGGWRVFARGIASSFLFLVGVSLYLAHRNGVKRGPYLKRLAMVAGAALAITIATVVAVPDAFIFFGILHHIAVASVLGLAFIRLPAVLVAALAVVVFAAPVWLRSPVFDPWPFWWLGLSETLPRSNDYVPLFPWFGAVLAGIAVGRVAVSSGFAERLSRWRAGAWARLPILAGRHSLAVYLLHQPVLIGILFLVSLVAPPAQESPEVRFRIGCEAQCEEVRDVEFCLRYCGCVLDRVERENRMSFVQRGGPEADAYIGDVASACTIESDALTPGAPDTAQ